MSDRWGMRFVLVAALVVLVGFALPALAQEETEAPGESPQTEEEKAIEEALQRQPFAGEITVTSRRREEALQEIPIAVSVVAGDQLEDIAASTISELEGYVPNLSIYQGRNQSTTLTAFIRGVGQADPLWGVDPGVGLYIDDVYIARAQGALLDVYDVERVEVLRGPQGTLYGKNTIGGAIKYVTKALSNTLEGRVTWNPGTFGTQEIRANISGPIVKDKLLGKASFAKLTRDGYGTNYYQDRDVSDKDTTAYRLALEWLPSDKVSLRADFDRTEDNAEPVGLTRLESNPFCWVYGGYACDPFPNHFDTESGIDPVNRFEIHRLLTDSSLGHQSCSAIQVHHRLQGDRTRRTGSISIPARWQLPIPRRPTMTTRQARSSNSSTPAPTSGAASSGSITSTALLVARWRRSSTPTSRTRRLEIRRPNPTLCMRMAASSSPNV